MAVEEEELQRRETEEIADAIGGDGEEEEGKGRGGRGALMQKFKRDMKLLQAEEKKALSKARGGGREEKEKISALYERKRKDLEEKLRRDLSLHDHRGSLPVDDRDDRQEEEESSPGRDSAKGEEEEKERGEKQVRASSKTNEEKISDGLCSEFSSLSFYGSRMRSSHEREEEERTGGGQGQQGGRGGRISKAYKRRQKKRIEEEEKLQLLQAQREAEGPSQGEIEMESLCMHLADQQLAIHPIAADGHCMYRAVCHQLSLENSPCPRRRKKEGEEEEDEDKYEGLSLLTVRHPESWSVDTLRDRVASFLEEHRDNFQPFLDYSAQSDEGFSAYCEKLRHTAEWGGELELQIIARLLKRHLLVYQMNGDLFLPLHYGEEFAKGGAGKQARKEEEEDEEEDQLEKTESIGQASQREGARVSWQIR